jgi:ABC-type transporter Mla subunit MlaD
MASDTEVQLVVSIVDKATQILTSINKAVDELGKKTEETNKKVEEGSKRGETGILSLNAAVELSVRGFELMKTAVEIPIEQFLKLFEVSEGLVRKYDAQFLAEQRLANAAKASGNATSEEVKGFNELSESMEKNSRFTAESIKEGMGLALIFGANAQTMPKVAKAAIDMAQAVGIDASQGFTKLGQAVETGALRPGGSFGRASFTFQKTGDAAKDLATVTDLALRLFGGSVDRSMKGGAASFVTMEHAVDALERKIGEIVSNSPQLIGFVNTVTKAADALKKFVEQNSELVGKTFGDAFAASFELASKGALLFVAALELAGKAISKIMNALDTLSHHGVGTSPFKGMTDDIAAQQSHIQDLFATLDAAAKKMSSPDSTLGDVQNFENIKTEIGAATDKLKKMQDELAAIQGGNWFEGLGESIKSLAHDLDELAKKPREPVLTTAGFKSSVSSDAEAAAKSIGEAAANAEKFGKTDMGPFLKQLEEIMSKSGQAKTYVEQLLDAFKSQQPGDLPIVESLKNMQADGKITEQQMLELSKTIMEGMGESAQAIQPVIDKLQALKDKAASFKSQGPGVPIDFEGTGGAGTSTGKSSSSASVGGIGGGGQAIDQAARAMSAAIDAAAARLTQAGTDLQEPAQALDQATTQQQATITSFDQAITNFSSGNEQLGAAATALLQSAAEQGQVSIDAGNALIQAANGLLEAANVLSRGQVQQSVPKLASGGVAYNNTLANVGDGGPEVILPLDARGMAFARSMLGGNEGGGGIQVDIHVERLDLSDRAVDEVVQKFQRKLADRMLETARRR